MPNKETLDQRGEALHAMLDDRRMEVHADDIGALIQAELNKATEDIDADLVDELLQLKLEREAGVQQEIASINRLDSSRGTHRRVGLRRLSIALVACLVLSLGVMGVASAFNWADLVHVFAPFMETLGINLNVTEERGGAVGERSSSDRDLIVIGESDEWAETESKQIKDERDMPNILTGYPVKPSWLPGGYKFSYGRIFREQTESSAFIAYTDEAHELFVQVTVYNQGVGLATRDVELAPVIDAGDTATESAVQLVEDHGIITATLVDGAAYYMVWGALPKQDALSVITSIGKGGSS